MKYLFGLAVFVVAGYFALQKLNPPPPPPPPAPPPPPPILLEPTPVISEAEQARVIKATEDQDPQVRWEAMVFLDKAKSPKAYPILFHHLRKDLSPEVRIKIINLLGQRKGHDISQNLVWALKDFDVNVKVAALKALDQVGDYATASAISQVLKDPNEQVRRQALVTLNSLQDKRAKEIEAERRKQEELRRQAEEAARRQKR